MGSRPPCQETWTSPLVFAGRVTAIVPVKEGNVTFGPRRVRFAITEAFRGPDTPEVDIHLDGSSCDPDFKEGEEYLVYGSHRQGAGWTASSCSRTRPLRDAAEDLTYLRLPDEKKGTSRIIGQVTHYRDDRSSRDVRTALTPVARVPVRVKRSSATGGAETIETLTDAEGKYSVDVTSHQSYEVTFGAVEGMVVRGEGTVWVPHHRACVAVYASASDDGRVSGVIVDSSGHPVPFLPLTLKTARSAMHGGLAFDAISQKDGRFEFRGIPPDAYVLRASERIWRDAHAIAFESAFSTITMDPAERLDVGRAALPASARVVLIEGVVVDEAGKPVSGVEVAVKGPIPYESFSDGIRTDVRGIFQVSLVSEQRYEFEAWSFRPDANGGVALRATEATQARAGAAVRLRLAPYR